MKKLLLLILMLVAVSMTYAQSSCPFHVKFETKDATCFNNGVVKFTLFDDSNHPIDLSTISTTYPDLTEGRAYYQANTGDSKHYSDAWADSVVLEYGTYIVGYEAQCPDGHGGLVLLDTSIEVTINTSYAVPTASAIYATSS